MEKRVSLQEKHWIKTKSENLVFLVDTKILNEVDVKMS